MPIARFVLPVLMVALLAACNKGAPEAAKDKPAAAASAPAASAKAPADAPVLLLSPEDLRTVRAGNGEANGPVVTGSIQPEKRADLRAEVAAVVTQVLKENGENVKRGDLLMRLDDTSIRESLQSADAGARAAQQAFDQAQRQVERLKTLQAQGMTSAQALDDAEGRRNSAQSELVSARGRVVAAQQQLRRTEVRAPFDGVASERKASVGDTAQVGKELIKVIDPRGMRFEGLISADRMDEVKAGQAASFRINGFGDEAFTGTVKRIDATANATTRQVEVVIAFTDPTKAPKVAGLYAEGRIAGAAGAAGRTAMLGDASVVRGADGATQVWRVKDGRIAKIAVQLGERDARSGEWALKGGVADGDVILRNPGATLVDGQKAEFAKAAKPAASAAK